MENSTRAAPRGLGRLRGHLDDRLYRTGYYLIIGTGITSLLGVAFWALAARSYSAHEIGQNAAAISAMTLVSGSARWGSRRSWSATCRSPGPRRSASSPPATR